MARLDPDSIKQPRRQTVEAFTEAHPVTLLLKGARTVIGEKGRPLSYNSTGNPGMASGGMGDALTGVCAALAGQGAPRCTTLRASAPGSVGGPPNWPSRMVRTARNRSPPPASSHTSAPPFTISARAVFEAAACA